MKKTTILIFQCIKVVSGIVGTSLVFTQKYPITTVIILAVGATANEILNFATKHTEATIDDKNENQ